MILTTCAVSRRPDWIRRRLRRPRRIVGIVKQDTAVNAANATTGGAAGTARYVAQLQAAAAPNEYHADKKYRRPSRRPSRSARTTPRRVLHLHGRRRGGGPRADVQRAAGRPACACVVPRAAVAKILHRSEVEENEIWTSTGRRCRPERWDKAPNVRARVPRRRAVPLIWMGVLENVRGSATERLNTRRTMDQLATRFTSFRHARGCVARAEAELATDETSGCHQNALITRGNLAMCYYNLGR